MVNVVMIYIILCVQVIYRQILEMIWNVFMHVWYMHFFKITFSHHIDTLICVCADGTCPSIRRGSINATSGAGWPVTERLRGKKTIVIQVVERRRERTGFICRPYNWRHEWKNDRLKGFTASKQTRGWEVPQFIQENTSEVKAELFFIAQFKNMNQ